MKVQFIQNRYMDQYHGQISFFRFGETREVSDEIGEYLLSTHGDKFIKIEDIPQVSIETTMELIESQDSQVLAFIKQNEPVGITRIGNGLGIHYTKLKAMIDELMKSEVLSQDPEKKYSLKRR